jgi:molybdenum cofactor guanylyltransferase
VFVVFEPLRQPIGDRTVKAGSKETSDSGLCHDRFMQRGSTSAAILAGGQARRFGGQDKSRLVVHGRSIIVRQVEVLQRVAAEVFVVARDPERFADLGLTVHIDRIPGTGAIGGIYTALDAARGDRVLVVACDLPFLDDRLLSELAWRAEGADGAWVRTSRGVEPLVACYQRGARAPILAEIQAGRLKASDLSSVLRLAEIAPEELDRFGSAEELLTNVNTPEDYARVQYRPR